MIRSRRAARSRSSCQYSNASRHVVAANQPGSIKAVALAFAFDLGITDNKRADTWLLEL